MRKVLGGVTPVGGGCTASCKDKDNNVLSPEGGISVTECGPTALTACQAQYTAATAAGCWCGGTEV